MNHPLRELAGQVEGLGVDVEQIERFRDPDLRLFTAAEVTYCVSKAQPAESFAGRWCAKEAVTKALAGSGHTTSPRDVEITAGPDGEPIASVRGFEGRVLVSIAHDSVAAVAVAWRLQRAEADPS